MGRLDYGKGADIAFKYFLNSNLDNDEFEFYFYSYPSATDDFSMKLYKELKSTEKINFVEPNSNLSPTEINNSLKNIIDNTDLFFLPYRKISSTIDYPLVPMEIISRNKDIITSNIHPLNDLIANKKSLVKPIDILNVEFIDDLIKLFLTKNKIYSKSQNMNEFMTSKIVDKLINTITFEDWWKII